MYSVRHFLGVAAVVAAITVLAAPPAFGASPKPFKGLKDCSAFAASSTCQITQSSLKILRGAVTTYTDVVFFADHFTSPMALKAADKKGSTATGRCTFYFDGPKAGTGHCDYWSGTGKLAGFHTSLDVGSTTTANVFSLTGTYWFDRHEENDDD